MGKIVRALKRMTYRFSEKGAAAVSTAVVVGNADKVSLHWNGSAKALKAKLAEWKVEKECMLSAVGRLIQDCLSCDFC